MIFNVVAKQPSIRPGGGPSAYLVDDNWDDWGKYRTMFYLIVFDETSNRHEIGSVKIGELGLEPSGQVEPGKRAPSLPPQFEALGDQFFSVGQDDNYYEALNQLSETLRRAVLKGLCDCAYDLKIFARFEYEGSMADSLLRSVSEANLRHRFHRLAHGNAALTAYYFEYIFSTDGGNEIPPQISFQVTPASEPPTNVHVLIGRNAVGKTRCLQRLAKAMLSENQDKENLGLISSSALMAHQWAFAGLVAVSFSAFDQFRLPPVTRSGMRANQVGMPTLSPPEDHDDPALKERGSFSEDFLAALDACRSGPRRQRIQTALQTLENDPLFAEAGSASLLDESSEDWRTIAAKLFDRLSSGHKIVLLTITRLVELVDERTIVLLDEPEGHLHPPLLSAFIRALSDLLIARNGIAIISTHSPVVLQEVPKSCVWMLRRSGRESVAERPSIETFGENVGILTREVFGLEVTNSGFHQLLRKAVNEQGLSFDAIVAKFNGQLGAEAQAILRTLIALRDNNPPQK